MPFVAYSFYFRQVAETHKLEVVIRLKNVDGNLMYYGNDKQCDGIVHDATDITNYGLQYYKIDDNVLNKYYLIDDIFDFLDNGGHKIYELYMSLSMSDLNYDTLIDDFNDIFVNFRIDYKIVLKEIEIECENIKYKNKVNDNEKIQYDYSFTFYIIHESLINNEDIKKIYEENKTMLKIKKNNTKQYSTGNKVRKENHCLVVHNVINHVIHGRNIFPKIDIDKELLAYGDVLN
jgi:hypothetical protein